MSEVVKLFRIVKTKWREHALDGEGAKCFGGRWNSKGNACVYFASSASLAQLEMLVHMQKSDLLMHYTLFELSIQVAQVSVVEMLPNNWQTQPAPVETAVIGDAWLAQAQSLALRVPSAIVTSEYNYLLNPHHSDFETIKTTTRVLPLLFDPRLR